MSFPPQGGPSVSAETGVNLIAEITPTDEGITGGDGAWDVAPSSLSNTTDEDNTTSTNAFKVSRDDGAGGGETGTIKWDLGELKTISRITIKYDLTSTAAGGDGKVQTSPDDTTWTNWSDLQGSTGSSTTINTSVSPFDIATARIRYIRFQISAGTSDGHEVTGKIYEIYVS